MALAPEDMQRDGRRARVAGLIAHAGRLTHLRLPTDDAGAWRENVASIIAPPAGGKGARILLVDAGTRANAAATLARELAEDGPAVLVDLTAADGAQSAGLSELMAGDAGFAEIIHRDPASRLHVIGAGHAGREAVLAARDVLDVALDALADAYDLVLVEGASRDVHRFATEFRTQVDGVLVLADSHANGHAVETAYKLAEGNDLPIAIVVFEEPVNLVTPMDQQPVEA
jgi:Mrp family chromosome partitioning ATPase